MRAITDEGLRTDVRVGENESKHKPTVSNQTGKHRDGDE